MKSVPDSIEISTLRCVLRALCETDIPAIASAMSDPGIADAVGWNLPCDPLALVAAVRASEVKWQTGTGFHFSIVSPLFILRYSSRRYCFIFQRIVSFFNHPAVNRLTLIISPLLFHFLQLSRPKE